MMKLTPEMEDAVNSVAKRMGTKPYTVLRRAILSYAAKFGGNDAIGEPDPTNVVSLSEEQNP